MKIAILSDSHDNLTNLKKAAYLVYEEKIKKIIHCGDVCGIDSLRILQQITQAEILVSLGNADRDELLNIDKKGIKIYQSFGRINAGRRKIAFSHFPDTAKELALKDEFDIVFYGHSHKPWEETVNKTRLVNPGNIAGIFYQATFATYDTANNELRLNILSRTKP